MRERSLPEWKRTLAILELILGCGSCLAAAAGLVDLVFGIATDEGLLQDEPSALLMFPFFMPIFAGVAIGAYQHVISRRVDGFMVLWIFTSAAVFFTVIGAFSFGIWLAPATLLALMATALGLAARLPKLKAY
jgi:hypothetical protein